MKEIYGQHNSVTAPFQRVLKNILIFLCCSALTQVSLGQAVITEKVDSLYSILSSEDSIKKIKVDGQNMVNVIIKSHEYLPDGEIFIGKVENCDSSRVYFTFKSHSLSGKILSLCQHASYDYFTGNDQQVKVVETDLSAGICTDFPRGNTSDSRIQFRSLAPLVSPEVYKLQSYPTATAVVLLDFDGYSGTSAWGSITAEPANVTETEIIEAWNLISEDFRPFDLNITTNEAIYQAAPSNRRMRCIFTPTTTAFPDAGGAAFIGTFTSGGELFPCWVFNVSFGGKIMGETGSHEIGHTMGLLHDGRELPGGTHEEYYGGNGTFAPIMGISFDAPVSHWSKGEYPFANQFQDDIQIIAANNGFSFRPDTEGSSVSNTVPLVIESNGAVSEISNKGVIENQSDIDYFSFTTSGGTINLVISPADTWPNLDPIAILLDQRGNVITASDPPLLQDAKLNINLSPGVYILKIDGTGFGNPPSNGYTDYSSVGQYFISGFIPITTPLPGSFTLVNALTDEDISPLSEGQVILKKPADELTIRFNSGGNTESVKFILNGQVERIENTVPYSLGGDENGDYSPWKSATTGHYELTAIPYSANNATGIAGVPSTIHFTISEAPAITSFVLINADTDKDIRILKNNDHIYRGQLGTLHVNIKINVSGSELINKVEIKMDETFLRTENTAPFSLFGDINGNYAAGNLGVRVHTLTATPILTNGTKGTPLSINFEVHEGNPPSKIAYATVSASTAQIRCYPNPSSSLFYFDIQTKGTCELEIFNSSGLSVAKINYKSDEEERTTLQWDAGNMNDGIYFYRYTSNDKTLSGNILLNK